VLPDIEAVETVILIDEKPSASRAWAGVEVVRFAEIISQNESNPERSVHDDRDPCLVLFTSGTTGFSKGCLLSHRWYIRIADGMAQGLTERDRNYTPYPWYHANARTEVLAALLTGGASVVAPGFSLSRFWSEVREHRATWLWLQGSVGKLLWDLEPSPSERDHSLRFVWGGPVGADPTASEERYGWKVVHEGIYAASEIGWISPSPIAPEKPGSNVSPLYQVKIVDENDEEVSPGQIGEILVRPNEPGIMFNGYVGQPEKTLERMRDLWFHTGDLGTLDERGRLRFVGRSDERLRIRGHMTSGAEVEEAVVAHPAVSECVAIGIPSEMGEEDLCIFVTLREGRQLTEEELLAHCRKNMARYMVPHRIVFLDDLPRTGSGKPARGELKKLATDAPGSAGSRAG